MAITKRTPPGYRLHIVNRGLEIGTELKRVSGLWRVSRLIEELRITHGDGSYIKFLKMIARASLIVLDYWGLTAFVTQNRADLLEILDDRVNAGSTLIASELPVDTWHAYLGESTLADVGSSVSAKVILTPLDRLVHQSHRIELEVPGDSIRKALWPVTA